jgi:phosphatidylglycerol lysyltransferase
MMNRNNIEFNTMDKLYLKQILKKYGSNTTSFQTLNKEFSYFTSQHGIEGYIAYKLVKNIFIVAGDPICSEEEIIPLMHEFRLYAQNKKAKICCISTQELTKKYYDYMDFGLLKIGSEGIIDIPSYQFGGRSMRDYRQGCTNAKNRNVIVEKIDLPDLATKRNIQRLNNQWKKSKGVQGFSFLLSIDTFDQIEEKLLFIAKLSGKIVGYLTCVPIYNRNGFYFEDIIRSNKAPNGTNHLLVHNAILYLKENNYSMSTLGTSPLGDITEEDNKKFPFIKVLLEQLATKGNSFYNFKGLYNFKQSFNPTYKENKYISFYPKKLTPEIFLAILEAYSPGGVPILLLNKIRKIIQETHRKIKLKS